MAKGLNAYLVYAVTLVLVSLAAVLGAGIWGLFFLLINLISLASETVVLKFKRPHVLTRSLDAINWWDRSLPLLMALCAVASAALSAYDVAVMRLSPLPVWSFLIGMVLLMTAYLVMGQSLMAKGPHTADKYDEEAGQGQERGSYETVRHPVMLATLLGGLSIPLFLGSGIGFAPIGLFLVALVVRVSREDDWRFNEYEWYYDYMKEVPYKIIPFIW